eukprot:XP_011674695.1 PREDICTED: nephrin-like [Strongylocentrotus purpuratus]
MLSARPILISITNGRTGNGYNNGESVSITNGRTLNLTCSIQDARPPAELGWHVPEEVEVRLEHQYNTVQSDAYVSRRVVSVTPSREDDNEIFRCVASHQELDNGLQLFILLDVQVPPSNLQLSAYGSITTNAKESRSVNVFEYSATSFTCKSIGSRPTALISWTLASDDDLGTTTSTSTTNKADQGLRDTISTLQLIPKRIHHNQLLICVASAGMNQRQTEVRVVVYATPRLLSITDDQSEDGYVNGASVTITSGRTHNLTCSVQGARPPAKLEWQVPEEVEVRLEDQYNVVHGDAYTSRRMVSVTPSRDDDGRILRCVAFHRELVNGLQLSIYLDVQVPPSDLLLTTYGSITTNAKDSRSVNVFEYSATSFTCKSIGSRPTSLISWSIGSDDDLGSTTSMSTTNEADQGLRDTTSTLQLIPKTRHHNQLLQCSAYAGMNQRQAEVRVIVNGPPDPPYLNGTEELQDGVSSNVTCTSNNGYPAPTFQWFLGSKNVTKDCNTQSSRNINHRLDAISLYKFTPRVDDHGELLVCHVFQQNNASMKSWSAREILHVLFAPYWVLITDERSTEFYPDNANITVTAGEPYDFTCKADWTRPPAVLEWRIPDDVTMDLRDQSDVVQGNFYVSRKAATITPSRNDQGKIMRCVASHPKLQNNLQRSVYLNVQVLPSIMLLYTTGDNQQLY